MPTQYQDHNGTTNWQDHTSPTPVILWIDYDGVYIGDPPADGGGNQQVLLGQICMSLLLALLPLV